jgi:hypothetical protein
MAFDYGSNDSNENLKCLSLPTAPFKSQAVAPARSYLSSPLYLSPYFFG